MWELFLSTYYECLLLSDTFKKLVGSFFVILVYNIVVVVICHLIKGCVFICLFGLVKFLLYELGQVLLYCLAPGECKFVLLVFWSRCLLRFFGCVFWVYWFGVLGKV